ncbi:hypothetical protein ONZ45_g10307 [Pleurotus djamor]|nr:hypothetical protein ONZ45_g10307 [Pleurotus djamor]
MGPIPLVEELHSDSLPVLLETEEADDEDDEGTEGAETSPKDYDPLEGDRIFCAVPPPTPEYARSLQAEQIQATETISQRLASAFQRNKPPDPRNASLPADLFEEFESVFSKESFDELPERRPWDHAIELVKEYKPFTTKCYPLSPVEQQELDAFIEENLSTGRIRPSKSPIASPVFFIKKKDGSLRLVQDYRKLNALTVKNRYLVDKLKGARYFSKLDVCWGYNNVRIKEGNEWKAAFRTSRGLFEPLVMFFGLTNSPATFQGMMNDLFRELITEGVVIIYLPGRHPHLHKDREEHCCVLKRVLQILKENKLYLQPEKCKFEQTYAV